MSVNGVTSASEAYSSTYTASAKAKATDNKATETKATDTTKKASEAGAVYEPSSTTDKKSAAATTKKTYTPNTDVIAKMKSESSAKSEQLRGLVEKLMLKQGETYNSANGIFRFLAKGDFTVDAATKAQAQADIGEDGYWGVKQTSSRILDFATALTGGDPDKIEEMRSAFKKGYEKAERIWGGQLPEISKNTYDAVLSGFDKMTEDAANVTE